MKKCTSGPCGHVQPAGDTCTKCGAETQEVSDTPAIRFDPRVRLATALEIDCFGTCFAFTGKELLKWWHEIAIAHAAATIRAEMYPRNHVALSPLCNYALLGEPGDISTFDGDDHTIPIGIQSTQGCQTIYLLKNLFTDGTKTKDQEVYALCQQLTGESVKRAPSYHEFASYYRKRTRTKNDRAVAEHLLAVIAQKENPSDLVEALFLGACLGSEFLRNRTSYIDTLLCLKLVVAGALTMDQLIVGGEPKQHVRIDEVFALSEGYFPDLKIVGKYVLAAPAIRAARYIKELNLESGQVAVKSTAEHSSSKVTTDANCWLDVGTVCTAFGSKDRWVGLSVVTCNPSQLGGALPMTGHNTQSLGSNALMVQLCMGTIGFTQVQAKTLTNIVRMLHLDCGGPFPVFFHSAFTRDVTSKITRATSRKTVHTLMAAFVRRQMVQLVFGENVDVPSLSFDDPEETPIRDVIQKLARLPFG